MWDHVTEAWFQLGGSTERVLVLQLQILLKLFLIFSYNIFACSHVMGDFMQRYMTFCDFM